MSLEQQRLNRAIEVKYEELLDEGVEPEEALEQATNYAEGLRDDYADAKMEEEREREWK